MATDGFKDVLREDRQRAANGLKPVDRGYRDVTSKEGPRIVCDWPEKEGRPLDPVQNRVINQDTFQAFTDCKWLNLVNLSISDITAGAFAGMPKLQQLIITGNHFESVRRDMFNGVASELEEYFSFTLYLPNNHILYLESQAFADIKSLVRLDLQDNPLTGPIAPETFMINNELDIELRLSNTGVVVKQGLFQHIPNLKFLSINENPFRFTPNMWQGLELLELSMKNAGITELNNEIWEGLGSSLKGLYLDGNYFETLRAHSFQGLTEIGHLRLANCGIRNVEALAFEIAGHSEGPYVLNLENNPILSIDINLFGANGWEGKRLFLSEIQCGPDMCWMYEKYLSQQIEYDYDDDDYFKCNNLDKSVREYFPDDCHGQ